MRVASYLDPDLQHRRHLIFARSEAKHRPIGAQDRAGDAICSSESLFGAALCHGQVIGSVFFFKNEKKT
jgi:hypothetical protein